jgi:transaldolase
MGASFRSTAQIEALAGCDRLTISPDLLETLDQDRGPLPRRLSPIEAQPVNAQAVTADSFGAALQADPMAKEKLATGIETFAKDLAALRATVREKLSA